MLYEDLISRINDCWKKACIKWNLPVEDFQSVTRNEEKAKKTDYFKKVEKAFKNKKNADNIDVKGLIRKCALFDSAGSNSIKANYLVNVIAHNCSGLVADYELVGLRFELESKTEDQTVDYRAFFGKLDAEEKEKLKALEKQDSKVADFEAVLLKICKLIQERESNIEHTFSVFTKQDGCIDPVRLRKLFEVIGFSCKDHEFDAIIQNAASRGENSILAFNLMR